METTRQDLRKAHQNNAKLIVMNRDSSIELAALKIEHERLKWTLSDEYRRESERDAATMGYAYANHTMGKP